MIKKIAGALTILGITFVLGLSLGCEKEGADDDNDTLKVGDFSIERATDSVKTDTLGASFNFVFDLKNHTDEDLSITVDTLMTELPAGWWILFCDENFCYELPKDTIIPANGAWEKAHMSIFSSTGGTTGKVVMTVSGGAEVDTQTFILNIQ